MCVCGGWGGGDKLIGLAFRLYGINWGFAVVWGWVEWGGFGCVLAGMDVDLFIDYTWTQNHCIMTIVKWGLHQIDQLQYIE